MGNLNLQSAATQTCNQPLGKCWCGKPLRYTWFAGQDWLICSGSHGTAYGPDAKRLEWEEERREP
jgi:hypothetical protein